MNEKVLDLMMRGQALAEDAKNLRSEMPEHPEKGELIACMTLAQRHFEDAVGRLVMIMSALDP